MPDLFSPYTLKGVTFRNRPGSDNPHGWPAAAARL